MSALNFGGVDSQFTDYQTARYVVLPIPYDHTSSWQKGSERGPDALLAASANMELYDIETDSEPFLAGIHTAEPMLSEAPPDQLYEAVLARARRYVRDGKLLVTLGGNHAVPIGSAQACCEAHPREQVSILQIDAHTDLRESYDGNAYSHACAMARMKQWGQPVQVGIRSMDASEKEHLGDSKIFFASAIHANPHWIDEVLASLNEKVYLTIDLDGLDPSIMPATGTPEPGGLQWYPLLELLQRVISSRQLLGFDVVELCPQPGLFHAEFLAAKLVYKIMAFAQSAERLQPTAV